MSEEEPPTSSEGYALEPEPQAHPQPPPIMPLLLGSRAGARTPPPPDLANEDVPCLLCGYNLRGLTPGGRCPECGTPIERSLHGNLLQYSAPAYLAALHRGVFFILASIIGQLILTALSFVIGIAQSAAGAALGPDAVYIIGQMVLSLLSTVLSFALLYGWWLFSAPDPAFVGVGEGTTARRVIRVTVLAAAGLTAISAAINTQVLLSVTPPLMAAYSIVAIVGLLVTAVKFFASMLYIRWLAPRLPNDHVDQRAKTFMWLIPLLTTVGILACGIGPLVALVLYSLMLNWIRTDIKRIRERRMLTIAEEGIGP